MLDILKRRISFYNNRNYNTSFISKSVKKERKINKEYNSIIKDNKKPLWIPSISSLIKLTFLFIFLGIMSHIGTSINIQYLDNITIPIIKNDSPFFQNLVAINTGIGAVLIGLAFFVAQSLMDKNDPDRARVLLYKSWFFPLLTSEVYIFMLLLTGNLNHSIILIVISLGIATVISLGKTVGILINSNDLENAKSKVFFDILKKNFIKILDSEINRRISNNFLHKIGEQLKEKYDGAILFNPFGTINKNNYITFKALKDGKCEDVNLKKLEQLISDIIKIPFNEINVEAEYENNINLVQNTTRKTKEPLVIIRPMLMSAVTSNTPLLEIRKDIINNTPGLFEKINKTLHSIFIVRDTTDLEQEARFEISKLKERSINAIDTTKTSELEKTIKVYNELVKEFFNYIKPYGSYTKEQAEKERGTFFGERLKFLDWISQDIREIFERGMKSDNKDIVRNAAFLPISLAKISIEYKDHLIYQNFINYPQLMYISGFNRKDVDKNVSEFMIDRSWRYISELSDFYLVTYYKDVELISPEEFVDFAQYILKVFQGLIKLSYDYKDLDNFKLFTKKMLGLFRTIDSGYSNNKIHKTLDKLKKEAIFGLGSWILSEVLDGNKDKNKEFLIHLVGVLPTNIKDITDLFISVNNFDAEHRWEWDNWEFRNHDDFEAFTIDILGKLEKFYVFIGLISLENKTNDVILNINLPISRELAMLSESTSSFMRTLELIKSDNNIWREILSEKAIKKVDILKELLYKAKVVREYIDKENKRNTRISEEKVQKFKGNVIKNIRSTFGIKSIYKDCGLVTEITDTKPEEKYKKFGINTFFDKSAFFNDEVEPYVTYIGIEDGFDFGRSITHGENNEIIKEITNHVTDIKVNEIDQFLLGFKRIEDLIFISVNNATFDLFEFDGLSGNYIPNWHSQFPKINMQFGDNIQGVYKFNDHFIPVYDIYSQGDSMGLFILDKTNMGRIIQYCTWDKNEETTIDEFFIDVQELLKNSTKEKEILNNPPKWLKEIGDKEEQSKYLQERVIIQIFEGFELKIEEKINGAIVRGKS